MSNKTNFRFGGPEDAYWAARRRIINNALRRHQKSLDLSRYGLTKLPPEIGQLQSLERLNLEHNLLTALPSEIGALISLRDLKLANNRLTSLPRELGSLASLQMLDLKQNPLPEPYPALIAQGQAAAARNVPAWLRGELRSAATEDPSANEGEPKQGLTAPAEPSLEAGPNFSLASGQLDLVPGPETNRAFDRAVQVTLHNRILGKVKSLRTETAKVGNRYPGLAHTVEEYAILVSQQFDDLDIVDLWAVGNGLLAHAISFEKQNEKRTLTEPLEPLHLGLLLDVARLHAGFILGFPKADELTERADRAQMSADTVSQIEGQTSHLLLELSRDHQLVSDQARKLAEALQAALAVAGWKTTRIGYTSYSTVRNALIQLCKALVWVNDKGGSLVGAVVVNSAFAASGLSAETIQLVLEFMYANVSNMAGFAAPFPELRAWMGWIIDHLDEEQMRIAWQADVQNGKAPISPSVQAHDQGLGQPANANEDLAEISEAENRSRSTRRFPAEFTESIPWLRRYARALTGKQETADDLVEKMLLRMIRLRRRYDATLGARIFLFKEFSQFMAASEHQFDYSDGSFDRTFVKVKQIPTIQREVFLLLSVEGFSEEQTAIILSKKVHTVRRLALEFGLQLQNVIKADVLIMEDELFIAMDLESLMRNLGLNVIGVARTAAEAVEMARKSKPGLLVADIQLAEGSSGLDAVNEIIQFADAPAIFITAYPERFLTGERPEPAYLISKPFQPAMVAAVAVQALFFERYSRPRSAKIAPS